MKNLIKDRDKLFLFVCMDIESTNNRAERAIRPVVISEENIGPQTLGQRRIRV